MCTNSLSLQIAEYCQLSHGIAGAEPLRTLQDRTMFLLQG